MAVLADNVTKDALIGDLSATRCAAPSRIYHMQPHSPRHARMARTTACSRRTTACSRRPPHRDRLVETVSSVCGTSRVA